MTDDKPKTDSLSQRSAIVHTVLGILALLALTASRLPRFAAYGDLITGACALLGLGTVAAAKAYLPPRVRAIVEDYSPTPVVAESATTGLVSP
jgi:hypothetical protein